ncbi:hypothetical protein AYI70_g4620 [Smittium culicis]|nr:hypothetical protein AYI70_g4620 [Smittium culicis]
MYDTNCPGISQSVAFYENTTFENKDVCAIHGIEFDPFNSFRFMANDRNKTIKFYDLRWPFSSLVLDVGNVVGSNIIESHYCKDRKGVISVLGTNRNNISVWEIDQSREKNGFTKQNPRNFALDEAQASSTINGYFDKEDNVGVQSFTFCDFSNQDNAMVESFSCYSNTFRVNPIPVSNTKVNTDYSPIIISCLSNGKILSSKYPKAQFASISPLNDIPKSQIDSNLSAICLDSVFSGDISSEMYNRAKKDYGFNFQNNMSHFDKNSSLWNTWKWLRDSASIKKSGLLKVEKNIDLSYAGIYSIINLSKDYLPRLEENYSKYSKGQKIRFESRTPSSLLGSKNNSTFSLYKEHSISDLALNKSSNNSTQNLNTTQTTDQNKDSTYTPDASLPSGSSSIKILRKISLLMCGYDFSVPSLKLFLNM